MVSLAVSTGEGVGAVLFLGNSLTGTIWAATAVLGGLVMACTVSAGWLYFAAFVGVAQLLAPQALSKCRTYQWDQEVEGLAKEPHMPLLEKSSLCFSTRVNEGKGDWAVDKLL